MKCGAGKGYERQVHFGNGQRESSLQREQVGYSRPIRQTFYGRGAETERRLGHTRRGEDSTRDEKGAPHIFDWVVLREVRCYAESAITDPRTYVRVVMSDVAQESKIDIANLKLLRDLEQRKVVERLHIPDEVFTGGEYRKRMIDIADAMLAIGGGRGTYSAGLEMTAQGKPVLPIDLRLGSISEDGDGAVALHKRMLTEAEQFFPRTHA